MITGRWGKPSEVLLDLVVAEDGSVRGMANPGRQNAPIRSGHFDAISFILFAELSNPTLAFYDRMGGECPLDDRGQFGGLYGWRDVRTLFRC